VNKELPLNEMALASARMLSVEEASRYAGGMDDPARLATAFAGVVGGVSSNAISIRGNSPSFLQWRLENVEAINPTHFSDMTGVGGGILTALSSQVLGNSDFYVGAFPAEFGNALSGVFDMKLRNGNNQKYQHTVQLGTLGVDLASEGPFKKGGKASYLFNYRYSSFALAGDLLPDLLGPARHMRYQDFTFKMNFPTQQAGTFTVWGTGIKDNYKTEISEDISEWEDVMEGSGDYLQTKAVGGVGHRIFLSENTYLRSSLSANYTLYDASMEQVYTDMSKVPVTDMKNTNWNVAFNTYLNTKFSATHTNRTGFTATRLFYDLDYWVSEDVNQIPPSDLLNVAKSKGNSTALSAYTQSIFRLSSRLTTSVGLHSMYFRLNEKATIEPRASIRWQAVPKHAFGIAYGNHSRRENTDYYFVVENGEFVNKNLNFAKAHHFVLSYDWLISEHLRFKVEPYYQQLYDVPVGTDGVTSIINLRDFWTFEAYTNAGKGRNYGIDFTLERYLHNGWYYLLTASLFESKYTGSDGVWRNTRLNRNFVINGLVGKEWNVGRQKQNILSASVRATLQGGQRYIPVNEATSIAEKRLVLDYSRAYEPQAPTELICHFNIGYKINRNKLSHEFSLKMINVTGTEEMEGYYYNYREDRPKKYLGAVTVPSIASKIEF
jgi:hypothetical protein